MPQRSGSDRLRGSSNRPTFFPRILRQTVGPPGGRPRASLLLWPMADTFKPPRGCVFTLLCNRRAGALLLGGRDRTVVTSRHQRRAPRAGTSRAARACRSRSPRWNGKRRRGRVSDSRHEDFRCSEADRHRSSRLRPSVLASFPRRRLRVGYTRAGPALIDNAPLKSRNISGYEGLRARPRARGEPPPSRSVV